MAVSDDAFSFIIIFPTIGTLILLLFFNRWEHQKSCVQYHPPQQELRRPPQPHQLLQPPQPPQRQEVTLHTV
jgi:hypothetical protein